MRQIKFRGKCLDKGKWVYGNISIPNSDYYFIMFCIAENENKFTYLSTRVDPATVGQFIGHFGRNRQDVYEGDRVTYIKADGKERVGVIKYHVDGFDIYNNGVMDCSLRGLGHDCIEVIGNIHDTPELLNSKQS